MYKKYLVFTVVFAFIALGGAYGYMRYSEYNNTKYTSDAKAAYATFLSENYEQSIKDISAVLEKAPNKSEQGRLKIVLAVSYWARNEGDDRTQAVKKLKEVVNDYAIPPVWRAQALNSIARFVNDSGLSFYRLHFTEAPYNTFLPSEGSDADKMNAVYMALLKYSDDTYPTSWAEYAIAYQYASLSVSSGQGVETKNYQVLMDKYVKDGDSRNDQSIYSPSVLISAYYYRALAMARSAVLGGLQQDSVKKVEEAYKLVFETSTKLEQDTQMEFLLLRARFYNANFLSVQQGREEDVKTLLKPFANKDAVTGGAFFAALKGVPENNFNKMVAVKLAKISPDFKTFLERIGISVR